MGSPLGKLLCNGQEKGNDEDKFKELFKTIQYSLGKKGKELRLFVDEFRTPVSAKAAISGIFLALEKVRGLIHLGGIERISRYDFGMLLMNMLNIQKAKLSPCGQRDVVMPAPRPPDVSLDSTKAFAMGFKPLPLAEELKALRGIV